MTHLLDVVEGLLAEGDMCMGGRCTNGIQVSDKRFPVSVVIFFPQVLIVKWKIFLGLVFPLDLLLEWRMEVCGVYFNRFWKLDLGFRNVMEKLGRKLKAKNESVHQIMHLLKIVTEFKKCSFFFCPSGPKKSMQTFSFK